MTHTVLLVVHVVSGAVGLLLGPLVIYQDARRFGSGHRTTGTFALGYLVVVLVVCVTSVGLVALSGPDLWWLVLLAVLTFGLVVLARVSARRRFRGWTHGYVHGLGGSYVALVTALVVVAFVVNGPLTGYLALVPWLAPAAVGTVLIEVWHRVVVLRRAENRDGSPARGGDLPEPSARPR